MAQVERHRHEADHEGDAGPVELGATRRADDLDRHQEKRRQKQEHKQDADHQCHPIGFDHGSIWGSRGIIASIRRMMELDCALTRTLEKSMPRRPLDVYLTYSFINEIQGATFRLYICFSYVFPNYSKR